MKKVFFLILMMLAANHFAAAQESNSNSLKELDEKIKAADKKLNNTLCHTTPAKCDAAAAAEQQKLLNEYHELKNERAAIVANAQRQERLNSPSSWSPLQKIFGPVGGEIVVGVIAFGGASLIFFLVVFAIIRSSTGGGVGRRDSHGSANQANEKELEEFTKTVSEGLKAGEFGIGGKINDPNCFHHTKEAFTFRHTMILGPTGTGKSRGFYMPNLEALANTGVSVLINDTKSELWETASGYWKNASRLAPLDPDASSACNRIPLCTDENRTLTLKIARTIVTNGGEDKSKEAFWDKAETALIAAVFAHTATTQTPTPAYAYDLLHAYDAEGITNILLNSPSRTAREQARTFYDAGERLRGSILVGTRVCLTWLGDPKIRRFTSSTAKPIDFGMMRNGGIATFWCLPAEAVAELRPLTCLVVVLALEQLKKVKGSPVYLMLDEFANMGTLPGFSTEITLLRSENIAVIAGIQSYGQLTERYGMNAAKTIIDNFATKLVLASLEFDSAERVSKHLGETTVIENRTSHTSGKSNSRTTSIQKHARRLMTANEITQIADNQVLVVSANRNPFFAVKWFFDKKPREQKAQMCGAEITGELPPASVTVAKFGKRKPIPEMPNLDV